MGAVQFVLNKDERKKKKMSFAEKQKIYPNESEILNNNYLNHNNFRDDISKLISGNLSESDINYILEKYNPKNKNCKISGLKYPKETILLYATGLIIDNSHLLDRNIDIFKYVQNIYLNLGLSEKEIEKCRFIEERFQKEFEMDLKLLTYDINKGIFQRLSPILYTSFNLNFALKDLCQPNILTLILNEEFLTKFELVDSLSEVIRYCPKLQIVNFILIPKKNNDELLETFGLDGLMFAMLYKLVEAVSLNREIKSFFLHSIRDYSIIMAPEISNLIIKKLQSETLVSLHIGNFYISGEFYKKLIFQFSSTRSLLFVSLENKYINKDSIITLKNVLSRNKSILALSLVTPLFKNMKPEIINKFKSTLQEGSKLEVVHLSNESLFNSYFK
jgi:hypothetical protein